MKINYPKKEREKGFIASFNTILILMVMMAIALTMSVLIFTEQRMATNNIASAQSYYTAQAGIEDSLWRLKNNPQMSPLNYEMQLNNATVQITIPAPLGGSRLVTAQSNRNGIVKSIQIVYSIDIKNIGFHYGAQVGNGGLSMSNNTNIIGNVFSTGNVIGGNNSVITGTVQVAGSNKKINGVEISGNAYADICENKAKITGTLHTNNANNCTYGSLTNSGLPVSPVDLPISNSEIEQWKQDALAGGTINGNYIQTNGTTGSLGPKKITGELIVDNNATLNVMGNLWVVGKITIKNGAKIQLSSQYGAASGIIISDSTILLDNGSLSRGSGQTGSYLMYISTSSSAKAIEIKNNARADIVYTNSGTIEVNNNAHIKEVIGYALSLINNAVLTYETGLANAAFTSGPGGGWKVVSWQEI